MPHWQAFCLSIRKNLTDKHFVCQKGKKSHWQAFCLSIGKMPHWQAFCLSITKKVSLTSKKPVRNQKNWTEPVGPLYFFIHWQAKSLSVHAKWFRNNKQSGKKWETSFTDKQHACQCNDCRKYFACTDKLFACQWIKKEKKRFTDKEKTCQQ